MSKIRVVSLQASNILRLSAVEFGWDAEQSILRVGGKNGAGKSSVLNAVAMALGGMALCPDEPLKRGERRGFVELNLGELNVKREFWRDALACDCETQQAGEHTPTCASKKLSEIKSRLIVRNSEGTKQEPAQRVLDRLIGKMTFDPTAFVFEEPKRQAEILRQVVGIDLDSFDEARRIAYDKRAIFNKQYKDKLVVLDAMPKHDNVPTEEQSSTDALAALAKGNEYQSLVSEAERNLDSQFKQYTSLDRELTSHLHRLTELDKERAALDEKIKNQEALIETTRGWVIKQNLEVEAAKLVADAAVENAKAVDLAALRAQLDNVETTNKKIRANAARASVMAEVVELQSKAETETQAIVNADAGKAAALRAVKFPVEGLGIDADGGVTFNRLPFKQASTAEQIRVSVAIGFALNPGLKLLCVKNGNALDDDSLTLVANAARDAGGQVLMEYVTKDASSVSVFIEDGHNV